MSYGVWHIEIPLKYCDMCIIQSLAHAKLLDVKVALFLCHRDPSVLGGVFEYFQVVSYSVFMCLHCKLIDWSWGRN